MKRIEEAGDEGLRVRVNGSLGKRSQRNERHAAKDPEHPSADEGEEGGQARLG